jgi:hypothetical protein
MRRVVVIAGVALAVAGLAGVAVWLAASPSAAQARVVQASVTYVGWPESEGFWPAVASAHPNRFQLPLSVVQRELRADTHPPKPSTGSCGPRHTLVSLVWSDGTRRSYPLCTAPESIRRLRDKLVTTYNGSEQLKRFLRVQYVATVRRTHPMPRTAVPKPAQIVVSGGTAAERLLLHELLVRMPAAGIAASRIRIEDAPKRLLRLSLASPPLPTAAISPGNARAGWAFSANQWAAVVLLAAFNHLAPYRGIQPMTNAWTDDGPAISDNRLSEVIASTRPVGLAKPEEVARQAQVRFISATRGPLGYGELIRYRIANPHDAQQAMAKLGLPRDAPEPSEFQLENPCGTPIAVLQSFPGGGGVWTDEAWIAEGTDTTGPPLLFDPAPVYPSTACG